MGRTAKPTVIKKLEDNPGKRPLNKREPMPKGFPKPPTEMSDAAKQIWKRVITSMVAGVYTQADECLLMTYCEAAAQHREATQLLKTEPKVVKGSTGQLVASPWLKIQSDAARLILQIGGKLGLDPVARQAINAPEDTVAEDDDVSVH